jgi:hypothetical protein
MRPTPLLTGADCLFQLILPPKSIPEPMRITCRYVKHENLLYPPTLNDGEGKKTLTRSAVADSEGREH